MTALVDLRRLARVCGLLGSDHDGGALAAARQAEKIRQKVGCLASSPHTTAPSVASGVVWSNTADMARYRSDLFKTVSAAQGDKHRNIGTLDDMRRAVRAVVQHDRRPWVEITYQPDGGSYKRRTVYAVETAVDSVRASIEAATGKPAVWRVRMLTYGRKDSLAPEKTTIYLGASESSRAPTADVPPAWMLPGTPMPAPGDGVGPA